MTTEQQLNDSFASMAATALRVKAERDDLLVALKGLMAMIDTGKLVRDTSRDHETGWALKQVDLVRALQTAQSAIDKAEGRQ